ncbi:aminotransferase class I/II-fold pyridoxal phosphate-dependent enzyme [bacterium]|nr:aminotransferase class I/II-fold pyridoxal phosphate-dependent enzyme [bacterium]
MTLLTPEQFLSRCSESSQVTYDLLKSLAEKSTDSIQRSEVRRFLETLRAHCEELNLDSDSLISKYHFAFNTLTIDGLSAEESNIHILQLPSIFTPEDWSFTFYEGLARYPASEFFGRTVVELGCGNGWISIALAAKTLPAKMIGLDINPRAITCARLNLLLNALDSSGTPRFDHEGKSLLDRIDFHTSDLLEYAINEQIQVDRVIGCIPQVLSPEPLIADHFVSENDDDQYLYSLSNYCAKQGYIEDQFGLGLIARALEEAITVAKPSAKVILNMGGRPGAAVLERLFVRRGFTIKKLWSTKVWQAADTDILPLVEIENRTPHRFEFFTSLSSDEPISARTAFEYLNKGGSIAHSLSVYEAQLKQPAPIKSLFKLIRQDGFEDSRNGLDLSFANDELAEEKINFIGSLAEWLQQKPNLPYSDAEGEPQLRRQVAQFLRSYWQIPLTAKSVLVAPNRKALLKNHLHITHPRLALIERDLCPHLPSDWFNTPGVNNSEFPVLLEAPRRVDETCKLIQLLKPQLVITSLQDFESRSRDAFVRLFQICDQNKAQLIIDLSPQFELSSQPSPNGVLAYLSENPLPAHVTLMFGLVRNKVYSDLELCLVVSENNELLNHLASAAELTYSRAPLLTQRYYGRIFSDLLNFQLTDLRRSKTESLRLPQSIAQELHLSLSTEIKRAFQHPAVAANHLEKNTNTVRMDYGENCLNSPPQVYSAIMESFLRQNVSSQDLKVERQILDLVSSRFGMNDLDEKNVLVGNGVAPLFSAAIETIQAEKQTIILPMGSYGYFKAACDYSHVDHHVISTLEKNRFKISPTELDLFLSETKAHWLYLNAPIVNPTGAIYSSGEITDLLDILAQHGCGLLLDCIFSGLEFNKKQMNLALGRTNDRSNSPANKIPIVLLGGLSKELAAGGLRFGWAATTNELISNGMRARLTTSPHSTVRHAATKIYLALNDPSNAIHSFIDQQRDVLRHRCKRISEKLSQLGWSVLESEGGLFVCASPSKYLANFHGPGKGVQSHQLNECTDQIALELFKVSGLLLNNATWTGLPSFVRFVVSVEENVFEQGLVRLEQFDANWQSRFH